MRYLKFIFSVVIVLLIITIIVENNETLSTTVHFNFNMFTIHYQTNEISIYYIAAVPFLLGVLITVAYGIFDRFRLKRRVKDLYKIIREKDKELDVLRRAPTFPYNGTGGTTHTGEAAV